MCKFEEEMKPYYERYDRAFESNDIKEIAYLSQFTTEKDIRKWSRRHVCENMRANNQWHKCGYDGIVFGKYDWHEGHIPNYEEQETIRLGKIINRKCCNMEEDMAVAILQIPNGKWIVRLDRDFSSIGHPVIPLSIWDRQYDSRTDGLNTELKNFIFYWKRDNNNVKKDDEAVAKAKSLIIIDEHYFENISAKKGETVQLSLFDF